MKGAEINEMSSQLPDWQVVNEHHLQRAYSFKDFRETLDFVNRVGELAEEQGSSGIIHVRMQLNDASVKSQGKPHGSKR